jgi:hypothetical protein
MKKNLSVIALAAALASCDAGNGKNDIIGFQLGMKKDAVHALADSNHWTCDNNSKTEETCYTMSGQMRVAYASHLEGSPVAHLEFDFHPGQQEQAVIQNQIKSISDQYGKKPDRITRMQGDFDFIIEAVWNLDNGNVLVLGNMGILEMINKAIWVEDEKASAQSTPTPKF